MSIDKTPTSRQQARTSEQAAYMHPLIYLLLLLLPYATFSAAAAAATGGDGRGCNRRCNSNDPVVPYPFGFSGDCPILLTCNATTSTAMLPHNTPILSFNSTTSTFLATVSPSCNRTVRDAAASLTSARYGVSNRTGLLLRGGACRAPPATGSSSNCTVPADLVTRLLRTSECAGGGNDTDLTCVAAAASGQAVGPFLRWETVSASGCEDALTATVYGDTSPGMPSLQFGMAELGWWLDGNCTGAGAGGHRCAANATCLDVRTPSGTLGHRCACRDGFYGDGFSAGEGCRVDGAPPASQGSKKNIPLIVAGVLAGLVAAAALLLLCRLQRRRSAAGRYGAAMRLLSEAASSSGVPVYSYNEVARATNGFSHTHRLGTGAYGTVYVGKLPSAASAPAAPLVAIKRLRWHRHHHYHEDDDGGDGEAAAALLLNEIKLISSVSHPGLVRLLGCCLDRGEQILVYEYVPNGTLSQHLHGGGNGGGGSRRLPWRARLGVAAETAAAIAYLHGMRPPIFHRDVKSSNILLDGDLRPKLADFGLSRAGDHHLDGATRSHVSTAPQGTPGYVDPEYHQNFHLSDKSDVYSFGVVLLELITAMKVVDFERPPSEVNLASLALDRIGKGRVSEIVDPALVGEDEWVMESVRHVSELAFRCLAFQKDVRPSMSEVAAELGRIRAAAPDTDSGSGLMTELQIDVSFGSPDMAAKKAASPVSVQEVWVSDRSSPSTNGSSLFMPRFV